MLVSDHPFVHPHRKKARVIQRRTVQALGAQDERVERLVRRPESAPRSRSSEVETRDSLFAWVVRGGRNVRERVIHSQRLKKPLSHKGIEGGFCHHFDNRSKNVRASVAIPELASRLKLRSALTDRVGHRVEIIILINSSQNGQRQSTAVRQELLDRDGAGSLVIEPWQVIRCPIVQTEIPLSDEELNRCAGQRLGHGSDVEKRVLLHQDILSPILPADGLVQDGLSVLDHDQFCSDDHVVLDVAAHHVG